ncbi:MAG: hypothetical protein ABIU85_02790 [Methylotenera sp.]
MMKAITEIEITTIEIAITMIEILIAMMVIVGSINWIQALNK